MSDAAPVLVSNPEPIDVAVHETPGTTASKATAAVARVDADILRTEDQRRISGIWERTQQFIALLVVAVALAVAAFLAVTKGIDGPFVFLSSIANLVCGFYFGRTNHQRVGGVGKDEVDGR